MASQEQGDHDPGRRPIDAWRGLFRGYRARMDADGNWVDIFCDDDEDIPGAQPSPAPPHAAAVDLMGHLHAQVAEHARVVAAVADLRTIVAAWQHKVFPGQCEAFGKCCQCMIEDLTRWLSVHEEIPEVGEIVDGSAGPMQDFLACAQAHLGQGLSHDRL